MVSTRYFLNRTGRALLTIFLVITLTFVLIRYLPGGPEDYLMAQLMGTDMTQEEVQRQMRSYINLSTNDPLWKQYIDYMTSVLQGSLGKSTWYQESVNSIVAKAMPWTIYISAVSLFITAADGIVIGAVMAFKEGSRFDKLSTVTMIVLHAIPFYIFAVVMLWLLAYQSGIFPSGGRYGEYVTAGFNYEYIKSILYHSALPILATVSLGFGGGALSMRANSIQVLGEDYIRVAKIRGVPNGRISLRYVARNAFLPKYTALLASIGALFGSSVILETLFNYTGMGYFFFEAVAARDYPLMMGGFMFITIGTLTGIYIADLTYGLIDPRAGDPSKREGFTALGTSPIAFVVNSLRRFVRGITRRVSSTDREETKIADGYGTGAGSLGGDDSLFNTVADVQVTRRDRFYRFIEEKILIPFRVLKADIRALVGMLILFGFLLMGTLGVTITEPPRSFDGEPLTPAFTTMAHPLGTNDRGMDLMAQVIHATPAMLKMMAAGALFSTVMAALWGLFSGYAGGRVDAVMMGIADVLMTIPGLPLIIVVSAYLQPDNPYMVGLVLTINGWAGSARSLRSQVLTIRQESYVEASRAMHLPSLQILRQDIWPNMAPLVMLRMVSQARSVVSGSVALYFLGILPFTNLNWGVMLNFAYDSGVWYNLKYIYWIAVPVVTLVLLSLGFVLLSQGFDRIFNPRIRAHHMKDNDAGGGGGDGASITDNVSVDDSSQM